MTIFEASFWENTWKDMNEWGKGNEKWAKGVLESINEWVKGNKEWLKEYWKGMNEWGKNNEIAFNQFIDSMKQLGKYDENKLKQAWNKNWDKMNEQNTEELLSKITEVVENKIKSSEIKNQEDFKQTMDELMKSSIEKMMQENLRKVMVEALQEVMKENTTAHDEGNTIDDTIVDEILAKHEGLVYSSQQKIFDTNEHTNNDYYYEGNL